MYPLCRPLLFLSAVFITLAPCVFAIDYTLAQSGQAKAQIIVPALPASISAEWAAKELQEHIRLISGATLPIISDAESPKPGLLNISVGDSALSRAAGLHMGNLKEQEYCLSFKAEGIFLLGRDIYPNPWPLSQSGHYKAAKGRFGLGQAPNSSSINWDSHNFPDHKGSIELWMSGDVKGNIWRIASNDFQESHTFYTDEKNQHRISYATWTEGRRETISTEALSLGWHLLCANWDSEKGIKQILVDGKIVAEGKYEQTKCARANSFDINPRQAGVLDEFRMSRDVNRYYEDGLPSEPFKKDQYTKLLLNFDHEQGVLYDGETPAKPRPKAEVPRFGVETGSVFAVYEFLEDYCGVRWYFAGDLGRVYPKKDELSFSASGTNTRRPAILYRSSSGMTESDSPMSRILHNHPNSQERDIYHMRMRMPLWTRFNTNHSFYEYYDRYWRKNDKKPQLFVEHKPRLFAKNQDGSPMGDPPPQMCYSEPEFIAQVVADAKEAYAQGKRFFAVVPMDNMSWCQCPKCIVQHTPQHERKGGSFSSGYASEYVWEFTAKVARELKEPCPELIIGQMSYADYAQAPKNVTLPDNVAAGPCWAPNLYFSLQNRGEVKMYNEWVEMKKSTGIMLNCWIYQCFPDQYGQMQGFKAWPGFHAHRIPKYLQKMAEDKVESLFFCGVTPYIDGYLSARLAMQPELDVDALLAEFFALYYGKAAEPMQNIYKRIEQSYLVQGAHSLLQSYDRYQVREILQELQTWMEQAKSLAENEEQRNRIALFEQAVLQHMLQGWQQFQNTWQGKPPYPFSYRDGKNPPESAAGKFGSALRMGRGISIWDHGFNDQAGTLELWVYGSKEASEDMSNGTIFHINSNPLLSQAPYSGHELRRKSYEGADGQSHCDMYAYKTWVGEQVQELELAVGEGWHQLMISWDAEKKSMQMALDGTMKVSTTYQPTHCALARRLAVAGSADGPDLSGESFGDWAWSKGIIDELRLSNIVRAPALQTEPYKADQHTLILLHFDQEPGQFLIESSGRNWQ